MRAVVHVALAADGDELVCRPSVSGSRFIAPGSRPAMQAAAPSSSAAEAPEVTIPASAPVAPLMARLAAACSAGSSTVTRAASAIAAGTSGAMVPAGQPGVGAVGIDDARDAEAVEEAHAAQASPTGRRLSRRCRAGFHLDTRPPLRLLGGPAGGPHAHRQPHRRLRRRDDRMAAGFPRASGTRLRGGAAPATSSRRSWPNGGSRCIGASPRRGWSARLRSGNAAAPSACAPTWTACR